MADMSMNDVMNAREVAQKIRRRWRPTRVAMINDYEVKMVRMSGDFVWHTHDDTDEMFLVISGEMRIDLRTGSVRLKEGDIYVVPRGVEHKPFAARECVALVIEPIGTINTGNTISNRTVYSSDTLTDGAE